MALPRGIRNNNPGNIDRGPHVVWKGQSPYQTDDRFINFSTMAYGVRALAKVLLTYEREDGLHTIREMIDRWAPPNENNTSAYVTDVAQACGANPDNPITLSQTVLEELVRAISHHENGGDYIADKDLVDGVSMALSS